MSDVIAFVRCDFKDPDLRGRFQPYWLQLLLDGELALTSHPANAWVLSVERAEEVVAGLNADPEWQTVSVRAGRCISEPMPVVYSVVKYRSFE